MDNRIYLGIGGAVAVGVLVWLTTRPGELTETDAGPPATAATPVITTPVDDSAALRGETGPRMAERPSAAAAPASSAPVGTAPVSSTSEEALPIDVSPGFEFLNKPASEMKDTDGQWPNWRHHQQLQSEPRDENWAPRIEAALRAAFQRSLTAAGFDPKQVELLVVECRTTGCEIQAGGYLADDGSLGTDFNAIYFKVLSGPLGAEFDLDAGTVSVDARPERRAGFLAFLPRKAA